MLGTGGTPSIDPTSDLPPTMLRVALVAAAVAMPGGCQGRAPAVPAAPHTHAHSVLHEALGAGVSAVSCEGIGLGWPSVRVRPRLSLFFFLDGRDSLLLPPRLASPPPHPS